MLAYNLDINRSSSVMMAILLGGVHHRRQSTGVRFLPYTVPFLYRAPPFNLAFSKRD